MTTKDRNRLQQENFAIFLEDGPRLSTKYNVWVLGKCTKRNKILLGGLGGLGIGEMWFNMAEWHKNYSGFEDAPEIEYYD
jgi:hypothetical protein